MATCKQLRSEIKHVRDLDWLCSKILHGHLNQWESQSADHMNPPLKVHARLLKNKPCFGACQPTIYHVPPPPAPFIWWRWQAVHVWCNSSFNLSSRTRDPFLRWHQSWSQRDIWIYVCVCVYVEYVGFNPLKVQAFVHTIEGRNTYSW